MVDREQIVDKERQQLQIVNGLQAAESQHAAQSIRIMGFVDGDVIPAACYDKPYRLEPGKQDGKAYDVLRDAMHRTRKVGLASVVIEKKQALAAVIPIGRTLVLNVLRFASQLVPGKRTSAATRPAITQAQPKPAVVLAVPKAENARRRPVAVVTESPRPVARMSTVRKQGEVIDLATRRSSKRAQARPAKIARARAGSVATLHQLRRKNARTTATRQLA